MSKYFGAKKLCLPCKGWVSLTTWFTYLLMFINTWRFTESCNVALAIVYLLLQWICYAIMPRRALWCADNTLRLRWKFRLLDCSRPVWFPSWLPLSMILEWASLTINFEQHSEIWQIPWYSLRIWCLLQLSQLESLGTG